MFTPSLRTCLLLCVAAVAASAGSGQPPEAKKGAKTEEPRPPYTAFPDLKPPAFETKEMKNADGTTRTVFGGYKDVPLPELPTVAADAPPLRKVRYEQLQEGLAYLEHMRKKIRKGAYTPDEFRDVLIMTAETFRIAAELEEKPAKRVPWYEERVRRFKEFEQFLELRITSGSDAPQRKNAARFQRLEAEAELLKLKAEVEKAGKN